MTLQFPSLPEPAWAREETWEDPAIRSDFEAGYEQTRPRYTRQRKTWKVSWQALTRTQKETLEIFWRQVAGGSVSFIWYPPTESTAYEVRFATVPEIRTEVPGYWIVALRFREV